MATSGLLLVDSASAGPFVEGLKMFCRLLLPALLLFPCGCRKETDLTTDARSMRLASGYTEIVVEAAKVRGYWANQVGTGERFFLFTADDSFHKGDVLDVEGAYGRAPAAVFNEETRVYQNRLPTTIFVVWKAALAGASKGAGGATNKGP
jgi:hypothetical protein